MLLCGTRTSLKTRCFISINYHIVDLKDNENTEAVIVVNKNRPEMKKLIDDLIDVETVLNIQKLVLEGKITPSY